MRDDKIKRLTIIAMLCAIAYVVMVFVRIPVVLFLKYEPKDIIITIGGFIYGPAVAVIVSVVVSLIELFSVSDTGIIGFVMNILSTCSFAYVAALIYKKRKNIKGAVAGLAVGTVVMCVVMLFWNYLITPLYMNVERSQVVGLLLPAILPFNILKGVLNSVITFIVYKPLVNGMRRANLIPAGSSTVPAEKNKTALVISVFLLIMCVLVILAFKGII